MLTREFLLSRGFCCNLGCFNCPYRKPKMIAWEIFEETLPKGHLFTTDGNFGNLTSWFKLFRLVPRFDKFGKVHVERQESVSAYVTMEAAQKALDKRNDFSKRI